MEDHVWIGGGCVLLPGVTIGKGSVIEEASLLIPYRPAVL
ncbi:MAG: hypothetical protein ACLT8C_00310 [Akkermansia muciniphila]